MSLSAWIVNPNDSTLLCHDDHSPCVVMVDKSRLLDLAVCEYAFCYQDKCLHTLPQVVLSSTAFAQLYPNQDHSPRGFVPYRSFVVHQTEALACAASHAIQLLRWRFDHRFCSRCGVPCVIDPHEYASSCTACGHRSYPRISPCVISAITRLYPISRRAQILLALHQRHKDGMHGLIAGFVEIGESLEDAVRRESLEETNLSVNNIRYISSQAWPYASNLMVGFWADYEAGDIVPQASELVYAQFFDLDDLPKIPNHGTIARQLIETVKHQLQP